MSIKEVVHVCYFSVQHIVVQNCNTAIMAAKQDLPTMWYVRPAKPQTSLRIRAV